MALSRNQAGVIWHEMSGPGRSWVTLHGQVASSNHRSFKVAQWALLALGKHRLKPLIGAHHSPVDASGSSRHTAG